MLIGWSLLGQWSLNWQSFLLIAWWNSCHIFRNNHQYIFMISDTGWGTLRTFTWYQILLSALFANFGAMAFDPDRICLLSPMVWFTPSFQMRQHHNSKISWQEMWELSFCYGFARPLRFSWHVALDIHLPDSEWVVRNNDQLQSNTTKSMVKKCIIAFGETQKLFDCISRSSTILSDHQ